MATQDYGNVGDAMLIEGKRKAWRRNFNGTALNPEYWTVSGNAPGMGVVVASGILTVNMNTGINEELVIQSTQGFQLPFRVQFTHSMSQRIANQEVYLEVVNAAGNTFQGWLFDGAVTTTARTVHANGGFSTPASPTTATTVSTTSTTPVIREIDFRMEAVDYADRTVDSSGASSPRLTKTRTVLDPDETYYLRMRFKNLGTAPASNTINTIETILVQDTNDVLVEIGAGRGNPGSNRSLPVIITNSPNVGLSNQSITPSGSSTVGTGASNTRQLLSNAGQSVKGSAGRVYGYSVSNPGAASAWFNIYNATAVTIGTTTPSVQVLVAAGQNVDIVFPVGVTFGTGIMAAATDTSSVMSAVAPSASLVSNIQWV